MTIFDDINNTPIFSDNNNGSFIQIAKGQCAKCRLPIYYPPKLQKEIKNCPYCGISFK